MLIYYYFFVTQWDPSSTYNGVIKQLSKGYDDWLSRFPMQTTNPHATAFVKETPVEDFSPGNVRNNFFPPFCFI